MKKTKIDLDIILPDVSDEKDAYVQRIINEMEGRQGIEEVHVVPENEKAQLCFHYNPDMVTIEKVQKLAEQAGAKITDRYHHLLVKVKGFKHQRQTRIIEAELKKKGVYMCQPRQAV